MTSGRQSGTARYRQVAQDLIAQVDRHDLARGERLAPEAQLAQRYGVNRLTIRRALEELARAGIVRTEHGVGSFIAEPAVRHRIDDGEASLSESMARRGIAVRHRVLAAVETDLTAGTPFPDFDGAGVEFRFVRYLEEEPWSIGDVLVPASLAPVGWDGSISVFAAMGARHGTTVKRAETAFGAALANPDEAGWLEVPVGSALLEVRGFNTDQQGCVVASFRHRIRGDRAEYVVRLPQ
jgi:DNA-binding GntR family transcriptional regulator